MEHHNVGVLTTRLLAAALVLVLVADVATAVVRSRSHANTASHPAAWALGANVNPGGTPAAHRSRVAAEGRRRYVAWASTVGNSAAYTASILDAAVPGG